MSAFAYSKIETVKSGDVLSADSYNEIINTLNEYGSSIKDLKTQNEWIYQNAFDTNEIWTGKYDTLSGKKIYSRWIEFGFIQGLAWERLIEHWIEWIDKIISIDEHSISKETELVYSDRFHHWIQVDSKNFLLNLRSTRPNNKWYSWIRLEYTKIDD